MTPTELLISLRLIKEASEFFTRLPNLLVDSILGTEIHFRERKEKIKILKEIVELRELAKILQRVYFFKGDLVSYAREVSLSKDQESVKYIKESFEHTVHHLEEFKALLRDTTISNTALVTQAALEVTKAISAYKMLYKIKDEDFFRDDVLITIADSVVKLADSATNLIKKLDEHRLCLDHSY